MRLWAVLLAESVSLGVGLAIARRYTAVTLAVGMLRGLHLADRADRAALLPAGTIIVASMYTVLVNSFGLIVQICLAHSGGSQ